MSGLLRRLRAHLLHPLLLAGLALVAAMLLSGLPRGSNQLADDALVHDVASAPYAARDLILSQRVAPSRARVSVSDYAAAIESHQRALPAPLAQLVRQRWFAASVDTRTIVPSGPDTELELRSPTAVQQEARLTAGRWPTNPATPAPREDPVALTDPVEIALSTQVARLAGLNLDSRLELRIAEPLSLPVVVVGLFTPHDPTAPVWDLMPSAVQASWPLPDQPLRATALTDPAGLDTLSRRLDELICTWRYRIDERRLDGPLVDPVSLAVARARDVPFGPGVTVTTNLDRMLQRYAEQLRGVRSLLGIVQAGLLATLLGLTGLAAMLAVERRRDEHALLRARGGTIATIGARAAAESLLVVPPAVLAGWVLGGWVPGRPAAGERLAVLLLGIVAVGLTPVVAMLAQRRSTITGQRHDLVRHRPTARRATAELAVVAVAGAGAYLLRRRGLGDTDVDVYLISVPVLLAVAAAVVALRILPWPVRRAGQLATRARGLVPFLGLAHAGRGAPLRTGPLAVLVVAVATGAFSGAVTASVDDARDRATTGQIPADAILTGAYFARDTGDRLAAVGGVTAVSPLLVAGSATIRSDRGPAGQAQVIVLDAPSFARVIAASGVDARLPATLVGARRAAGAPVPAVVSPEVAADLGPAPAGGAQTGTAPVGSRQFDFTVGAVADRVPGVDPASTRFIVLPWQALPDSGVLHPNRFLIAGTGFDPAALRRTGDDGQRAFATTVLGQPVPTVPRPAVLSTWVDHRAGLENTGANSVLTLAFRIGVTGATVLALFAVVLGVLAGAHSRGQVLSRLLTMGLSRRQGRALLLVELTPMVGLAVLTGLLVGILLPLALRPALGLDAFTAGMGTRARLDPLLLAAAPVLILSALGTAVLVENVTNRRLRLGELLRLGEGS